MYHEFHEATGDDYVAPVIRTVKPSAYEVFMDEQNIPIYRGIGLYDVRELPLAPWQQMGGQGTFIELDGQARYWGMYVVEVPAGGALNSERHMYEELFLVFEGHGSAEVWREGNPKRQTFEWQPGSNFAVPVNAWHRLVNATSSPALVLVATSAPNVMELFPTRTFIFDNPYEFRDRYDEREDYFKPQDKLVALEEGGRGTAFTSLLPDVINCYLPLENHRGPGHRVINPQMAGNTWVGGFIAEYPSGRYSLAHSHEGGAVLVCLRGKGYSLNWPLHLGKRPWETGKGHLVNRQDYIPGGMVAAAPGTGDWFHQHFSTAKEPLRVRAIIHHPSRETQYSYGEDLPGGGMENLAAGRHVISYRQEDPQVRKDYQEALEKEGAEFTMPESIY